MSEEPTTGTGGTAVPRPVPGLRIAVVDDAIVVLDRTTAQCHVLNPTASVVWELVDGVRPVQGIVDVLAAGFDVDHAVVAEPVERAVGQFIEIGIMRIDADGRGPDPVGDPAELARVAERESRLNRWAATMTRMLDSTDGVSAVGTFAFLDVVATIRTDDPDLARDLDHLLGPLAESGRAATMDLRILDRGADGASRFRVYMDGLRRGGFPSRDLVVEFLLRDVTARAISATGDALLLHAGAVERDGRVVVIAGLSGDGKSTLVAALVRAGFAYLTDELVAIDPGTGRVVKFAKPLDLDDSSRVLLGLDPRSGGAADSGLISANRVGEISDGGRVAMFVVLDPEGTETIETMDPVDCLTSLLPNVFLESYASESAFQDLADLSGSAASYRLARLPIERSVELLVEMFDLIVDPD